MRRGFASLRARKRIRRWMALAVLTRVALTSPQLVSGAHGDFTDKLKACQCHPTEISATDLESALAASLPETAPETSLRRHGQFAWPRGAIPAGTHNVVHPFDDVEEHRREENAEQRDA
jgi:hypothetical protein